MRDTDYAYGVAKIRYHELSLLSTQELDQLVSADSVGTVLRLLADKGWDAPERGADCAAMLENEADKVWVLLNEAAPDIAVFDSLIMQNDFHNLKASIKSLIAGSSPDDLFITPSVIDPHDIDAAVREKRFDSLPEFISTAAREGYEVATVSQGVGRLVDIVVDKICLEQRIISAQKSGVRLLEDIARVSCAAADIKIALRSADLGRDAAFMDRAMAQSGLLDNQRLIASALKGRDELMTYLDSTQLDGVSDAIREGGAAFEKWCDDAETVRARGAGSSAFGAGPLAAYYLAKLTEIRNVRIIVSAKHNGISTEKIRERVRRAYA